jgi:hypothetical protein
MTTLQTFFRAVVMLATLGIVAKAWMLYGPSVEEMQTIGQRVVEVSHELIEKYRQGGAATPVDAHDPRIAAVPALAATMPPAPVRPPQPVQLAAAESSTPEFAQQAIVLEPVASTPPEPPTRLIPVAPQQPASDQPSGGDARLEAAAAQLAQFGVHDYQVMPWGSDGRWYRCSCDAAWIGGAQFSRHFEAVAADPASAAEQVAAEIDAWRRTQSEAAPPPQTSLTSGVGQ